MLGLLRTMACIGACAVGVLSCAHPAPAQALAPPPPPPPALPPLVVLDAAAEDDELTLYANGARLRDELLRDLIDAVGTLRVDLQVELRSVETRCGFQPILAVDELLVGLKWQGALPVGAAVARLSRPLADAERCLQTLVPDARVVMFDGRRSFQVPGGFVTSARGDLLVLATSAAEARAKIQRMEHPFVRLPSRASFEGAMMAGEMHANNPFGIASASLRWDVAGTGTKLAAHATFREEASARSIERILKEGLLQALGSSGSMDPGVHDVGTALVQGTTVTRTGPNLELAMAAPSLHGHGSVVGQVTALALRGARHYVAAARMAEARDGVYKIARALADVVERERQLGQPMRFPSSAPLVPSDVPYGKPAILTAESFSHPSWRAIGYSIDGAVNYATDFVTAPDGKSVVVRARGDIDRDGVTSLFELDVRIDRKGTVFIGPIIRERDAEE